VISTPYWHAAELLKDERGVLIPFADPGAIARAVSGLLRDEARRNAMSDNAYKMGREMVEPHCRNLHEFLRDGGPGGCGSGPRIGRGKRGRLSAA